MLLRCDGLRIDLAGAMLVENLSFEADGDRVALVGDFRALFEVLSARGQIVKGRFEVLGEDAATQVRKGAVGLVLGEARGGQKWTVLDFLTKSALLLGLSKKAAGMHAARVLERLGLAAMSTRRAQFLTRTEQLALELGDALLSDPSVLFLRTPLQGLSEAEAAWLWPLIERAAVERRLIVSFEDVLLEERAALARFDRLVVSHRGRVTAVGPPAELLEAQCFLVSVTRGGAALGRRLEEQGCRVHLSDSDDSEPAQLLVTGASESIPQWVAQAVSEQVAVVIELIPLAAIVPGPPLAAVNEAGSQPH